jgi:hypothetical protein
VLEGLPELLLDAEGVFVLDIEPDELPVPVTEGIELTVIVAVLIALEVLVSRGETVPLDVPELLQVAPELKVEVADALDVEVAVAEALEVADGEPEILTTGVFVDVFDTKALFEKLGVLEFVAELLGGFCPDAKDERVGFEVRLELIVSSDVFVEVLVSVGRELGRALKLV